MRCGVAAGIGPFAQGGLDEALSLAIGPGHIGPCADMLQAWVTASSGKGFRDIAAAITGHDTGHFHTGPLVPGDGGPEVDNSTERFFIGMDLAEGEARMVVNADMHIFPAIAANRSRPRGVCLAFLWTFIRSLLKGLKSGNSRFLHRDQQDNLLKEHINASQ